MKNLLKIIIVAGFVTASFNSLAADWTITQSTTIDTTTNLAQLRLNQGVTTAVSDSRQAINGVVLNGVEDNLASGSQRALITARGLEMKQEGGTTAGSSQAVNYIFAKNIGGTMTGAVTQTGMMTGVLQMAQKAGGGSNVQGGNVMVTSSTGKIVNAEQEFIVTNETNLAQEISSNTNNVQALNLADTTANTTMTGTVGTLVQRFRHTGASGVTLRSANAASGNIQAGNMVDSLRSITDLEQTFSAGSASQLFFTMPGTGSSNIQAGNMARIDGDASVIVEIRQAFTGSLIENTFRMVPINGPTASDLVQAGNLIALGIGAITDMTGPHQEFTTTTTRGLSMVQAGGVVTSLQALNAITDKTGGSAATQARQLLTASGAFSMAQRVATDSGQFGNFAGLSLVVTSP